MKCKLCGTEMLVDTVENKDGKEFVVYKCPNKRCSNYGYTKTKEDIKDETKS